MVEMQEVAPIELRIDVQSAAPTWAQTSRFGDLFGLRGITAYAPPA